MFHFERTVTRNGVVQRDDCGNELFEGQDAVTQALVVVHKIEFAGALREMALDAGTKSRRFAKGSDEE